MKRFLTYLILVAATAFSVSANERVVEHRVVVDIPFRLAGSGTEHIRFDIDSVGLAHSMRELKLLAVDTCVVIKRVEFYSSVSPEGSVYINKKLGRERLATAERVVRKYLKLPKWVEVVRDERYIPWREVLLPAVLADKDVPYRDELLRLCNCKSAKKGADKRLTVLKEAHGGKLWEVVKQRYFDYLRKGGAIITVDRTISSNLVSDSCFLYVRPVAEEDMLFEKPASAPIAEPVAPKSAISIKTNAAAVAALITNLGFEVKLAPRWSLDVMGAYSPYNMVVTNRKIRVFGIRPEVRFWWGEPMKRGHFIGLHGFTYAFNVQINDKARYQDPNHALWGTGLAYGYALPLGKKERWGVEFTIGAGYARIKYDKYDGVKNGQFIERKTIDYFGPTRLGVNFSYRFDIEGKQKGKR